MSLFSGPAGPLVILGGGAVLLLLLDLLWEGHPILQRGVALVILALAAWTAITMAAGSSAFSSALLADLLGRATDLLAVAGAAAAILLADPKELGGPKRGAAYLALVLWSSAGMVLAGGAGNLVVLFVGIEVLSLGLYVLTAFGRQDGRGAEAGFKYFVLGGLGSALLLYGSALTYAATGSLGWHGIAAAATGPLVRVGLVLILAGLGFKLALAPFQLWTPDVYDGAPTSVAAFMAVGTKAAAFAALGRVLVSGFGVGVHWVAVVAVLGLLSMFVGYLGAIGQTGARRLLAFSGIANAGTLVLVLLAGRHWQSLGFLYLAAYAAASLGFFATIAAVESDGNGDRMVGFVSIARQWPWLGAALIIALLSLAGVPPTGGFMAKLLLLRGLFGAGHPWIAMGIVVASIVGLYPYFRWLMASLDLPESSRPRHPGPRIGWGLVAGCTAVATLLIGILPGIILHG